MPCRDGYPSDYEMRLSEERNEIKRRLDLSTKLLCGVLRRLRKASKSEHATAITAADIYPMLLGDTDLEFQISEVKGLRDWWINHQREDRERAKADLHNARNIVRSAAREIEQHKLNIATAQKRLAAAKKTIAKATKGKK